MANRSLKARILRNKRKGKFKTWKNNPRGGSQAPLRAYSIKRYTTPSQDVELWHGQTLGKRAKAAQNTVRIPAKGEMARDVHYIPLPPTQNLTFGRVINTAEGPLPTLIVLDKLRAMKKEDLPWYMDHEYNKWAAQYHHIALDNKSDMHKVEVFFSGSTFIIVEVTPVLARRSVIYNSFERAKRRWFRRQVRWAEIINF